MIANSLSISRSVSAAEGSSITTMRAFFDDRFGDLDHLLLGDRKPGDFQL